MSLAHNKDLALIESRYPHIAKAIAVRWGTPDVKAYIEHLFTDTRDGNRQGFPKEIHAALYNIYDRYNHTREKIIKEGKDLWIDTET